MKKHVLLLAAFAALFVSFISCSSDDPKTSQIEVRLVDAPGDYDAVNIDIQDVMINKNDGDNGWQSIGNVTPSWPAMPATSLSSSSPRRPKKVRLS